VFQQIIIIGNLGSDPEMRYMPDGTAVANFSVATNRRWTDRSSGQQKDETTWFRVSVWGRQAESVNQYLSKGRQVMVQGRIAPDPQTGSPRVFTRQDGTAGSSFEIRATTVQFIGGREATAFPSESDGAPTSAQEEDEIPF